MPQEAPSKLFTVVGQEPDPSPTDQQQAVATKMIYMALAALGQRFVVAISNLFTLLTVSSAFVLWLMTPDPNTKQIISLGIYAGFVLAINIIIRRIRGEKIS